jgi:predicted GNAT superfamily acetyltransferase
MTRGSVAPPPEADLGAAVELRALHSAGDFAACVQLQRDTWGADYWDTVPASLLKVTQMVGGVCGGAFAAGGRLVGFVFGMTGVQDGRVIHWSHMLAVRPEYRDHGVGRQLKEYQRATLRALGVERMYWTFDPLVARNAHLNLNRLGTVVEKYVPEMYGDTGSGLHAFGTDRFVVSLPVAASAPARTPPAPWRRAPLAESRPAARGDGAGRDGAGRDAAGGDGAGGDGEADGGGTAGRPLAGAAAVLRIEIPADVMTLPVLEAQTWRARTRPAFVRLLADGYRVAGFFRDGDDRCYYVLSHDHET